MSLLSFFFHKNKIKKNILLLCLSKSCPEEYILKYFGFNAAYIRLRNGILTMYLTPSGELDYSSVVIFSKNFRDKKMHSFKSSIKKCIYVNKCKNILAHLLIYDAISSAEDIW